MISSWVLDSDSLTGKRVKYSTTQPRFFAGTYFREPMPMPNNASKNMQRRMKEEMSANQIGWFLKFGICHHD